GERDDRSVHADHGPDRRDDRATQSRAGPICRQRLDRSGLHHRRFVPRLGGGLYPGDRSAAGGRRSGDLLHRAGLSRPLVPGQHFLRGRGARSDHAAALGARHGQQLRRTAQAGNVCEREDPHRRRRQGGRGPERCHHLRGRSRPRMGGARQRQRKSDRAAADQGRAHQRQYGRGGQGSWARRSRGHQGQSLHRSRGGGHVEGRLETERNAMNGIVAFSLKQRVPMVMLFVMILFGGVIAFRELNIEAYPDPTPPMVDVITQSPGLSAEEIERYITIPIEVNVATAPHLTAMRTISLFGLSDVKLQFSFDFTYEQALQQVLNRLSQMAPLPNGAQPQISPVSPIGEIYRYRLVGPPGYSVLDLKTMQDWVLQRRFRAVPGVIDVIGWRGKTKTFELEVDFNKLIAYGVTLPQLLQTLNNSNINVGGNTVNIGPQSAVVRGVGLIRSLEDLNNTMLTQSGGNPVLVKDVARVIVGFQPRLGIAGMNDSDDIVEGIVLMRRGEKSTPTIKRVEQEVDSINSSGVLPPGVRIERIYDRKDLIEITTHTVLHNMLFGIVLIFFLQWIFLGNLRSAIIVGATIPFALFFAIGILVLRGESANLLSVGAIDFGLIVDATVIMVENIFRRLGHVNASPTTVESSESRLSGRLLHIYQAAVGVNRSIFFAAGII